MNLELEFSNKSLTLYTHKVALKSDNILFAQVTNPTDISKRVFNKAVYTPESYYGGGIYLSSKDSEREFAMQYIYKPQYCDVVMFSCSISYEFNSAPLIEKEAARQAAVEEENDRRLRNLIGLGLTEEEAQKKVQKVVVDNNDIYYSETMANKLWPLIFEFYVDNCLFITMGFDANSNSFISNKEMYKKLNTSYPYNAGIKNFNKFSCVLYKDLTYSYINGREMDITRTRGCSLNRDCGQMIGIRIISGKSSSGLEYSANVSNLQGSYILGRIDDITDVLNDSSSTEFNYEDLFKGYKINS